MIVKLVSKYLTEHKRLVIPNLGTFIVKVPGQTVLFSNLIKTDDGVLRSLLTQNGISEIEAAAAMDRFVFEAQYRLQNNGKCRLSGFGELRSGANGTITFIYEPTAVNASPVPENAATAAHGDTATEEARKTAPSSTATVPTTAEDADSGRRTADDASDQEQVPSSPAAKRSNAAERAKTLYGGKPAASYSDVRNADYIKGLRYGKGRRRVPAGKEYGAPTSRRISDSIMIIAIIAALLAIAALAYGMWCDWRASADDGYYETPQSESETTVRNPDLDYIQPYDK